MGGVQNLYVVNAQASSPPSPLTSYTDGTIGDVSWTQDGHALLFIHAGDLWQVSTDGGEQPKPLWTTPAAEARSPCWPRESSSSSSCSS